MRSLGKDVKEFNDVLGRAGNFSLAGTCAVTPKRDGRGDQKIGAPI
jgi:hypothetical protein